MFDSLPDSENGRFSRFGRPAEPSAPKGRRFGRLQSDSRFPLQNFKSEASLVALLRCCQAPYASSCFSSGSFFFAKMNQKPAVLKNFVFYWGICFCLCEVNCFQNLVSLELPIKHSLKVDVLDRLYQNNLSCIRTKGFLVKFWVDCFT